MWPSPIRITRVRHSSLIERCSQETVNGVCGFSPAIRITRSAISFALAWSQLGRGPLLERQPDTAAMRLQKAILVWIAAAAVLLLVPGVLMLYQVGQSIW